MAPKNPKIPPKSTTSIIETGAYSNHAQVTLTNNEFTIDYYYVSPKVNPVDRKASKEAEASIHHIQRIIAPVSLAKGLANAIANVVAAYEADHNISLPNARSKQPEDKISIWDEKETE